MSITHTIVKLLFHELLHARRRKAVTEEIQGRRALERASRPVVLVVERPTAATRTYGEAKTRWTADMRAPRVKRNPLPKGYRAIDC